MPQSKKPSVFVESGRMATSGEWSRMHEFQPISTNSRIYYAFPPELKIVDFGHSNALTMRTEVFYFQDASSAEPVWLAEGFP